MTNQLFTRIYEAAVESQSYSPESFSLPAGENEQFLLHMLGIHDVQIFRFNHFRKQAGPEWRHRDTRDFLVNPAE